MVGLGVHTVTGVVCMSCPVMSVLVTIVLRRIVGRAPDLVRVGNGDGGVMIVELGPEEIL